MVKAVVHLTDMADYPLVSAVSEDAFAPNRPARTCVAVSALPVRERMKIETVAFKGKAQAAMPHDVRRTFRTREAEPTGRSHRT